MGANEWRTSDAWPVPETQWTKILRLTLAPSPTVDFALAGQRDRGLSPLEAIREACLLRFRPIMMTTMAALLAGVPLMLGHGTGSELRQPLGYSMVGGLILSQALTLYTTPVVFLYLDQFSEWLQGSF